MRQYLKIEGGLDVFAPYGKPLTFNIFYQLKAR